MGLLTKLHCYLHKRTENNPDIIDNKPLGELDVLKQELTCLLNDNDQDEKSVEKIKDAKSLQDIYVTVHGLNKKGKPLTALCLSGGGIRSATFCLGVLKALARNNSQLKQFHYLSTVSGGGYIGSWLSRWIK